MSHTHKDQPGGHRKAVVEIGGWMDTATPRAARFAKKFTRREARREAKRATLAALADAADEAEWLAHAAMLDEMDTDCMYEDDMYDPYVEERHEWVDPYPYSDLYEDVTYDWD